MISTFHMGIFTMITVTTKCRIMMSTITTIPKQHTILTFIQSPHLHTVSSHTTSSGIMTMKFGLSTVLEKTRNHFSFTMILKTVG